MMKQDINDYLRRIRECSDEIVQEANRPLPRLTAEYGIKNNLEINSKGSIDDWISHLKSRYRYEGFQKFSQSHLFIYSQKMFFHSGEIPSDYGIENYNISTIINYENIREEIACARDAANLLIELSQDLKNQGIPFELITSIGAQRIKIKCQPSQK